MLDVALFIVVSSLFVLFQVNSAYLNQLGLPVHSPASRGRRAGAAAGCLAASWFAPRAHSSSSAAWVLPAICPNSVLKRFGAEAEQTSHLTSTPASQAFILAFRVWQRSLHLAGLAPQRCWAAA